MLSQAWRTCAATDSGPPGSPRKADPKSITGIVRVTSATSLTAIALKMFIDPSWPGACTIPPCASARRRARVEVGQDVAAEDDGVAGAERARGLHELALAQREHDAAHEARVDRKADDGDGHHRVAEAGTEAGHDGDGEQHVRKRHQDVGETH